MKGKRRKRARRVVLLTASLAVIAGGALWIAEKPRAPVRWRFRATVSARSLSFVLGSWSDASGAGIFNSEIQRVAVTLDGSTTITSDLGTEAKCSGELILRGVKMVRMATTKQEQVALDVESTGRLHYTLTPGSRAGGAFLEVQTPSEMDSHALGCAEAMKLGRGNWTVRPQTSGDPLEFLVDFDPAARQAGAREQGPEPETEIPLEAGSSLTAKGGLSDATGGGANKLEFLPAGRAVDLQAGLLLQNLTEASIERLRFDPATATLQVTAAGLAKTIREESGGGWIGLEDTSIADHRRTFGGDLYVALATLSSGLLGALISLVEMREARRLRRLELDTEHEFAERERSRRDAKPR